MAILTPNELDELEGLMADALHRRPPQIGEDRLRYLLGKENPRAYAMGWDELLYFGKIVIGLAVVFGRMGAKA